MSGEPIRLDHYRERVEVDTGPERGIVGRGQRPVYVVGLDKRQAADWAYRNKGGSVLKFCHAHSATVMAGLYLKDEAVFVLSPLPPDVREAWHRTGARLVYL